MASVAMWVREITANKARRGTVARYLRRCCAVDPIAEPEKKYNPENFCRKHKKVMKNKISFHFPRVESESERRQSN